LTFGKSIDRLTLLKAVQSVLIIAATAIYYSNKGSYLYLFITDHI